MPKLFWVFEKVFVPIYGGLIFFYNIFQLRLIRDSTLLMEKPFNIYFVVASNVPW